MSRWFQIAVVTLLAIIAVQLGALDDAWRFAEDLAHRARHIGATREVAAPSPAGGMPFDSTETVRLMGTVPPSPASR